MSKKSKKTKSSKFNMWIAIVLILAITNAATVYYFMFYQDTTFSEDVPLSMENMLENPQEYYGSTITLLGYYIVAAGNQLLVANPLLFFNNSLNPGNYVVLGGSVPATINESLGRQVAVKGFLQPALLEGGGNEFMVDSFIDIAHEIEYEGPFTDSLLQPSNDFNDTPYIFDPTQDKYAVLYCGGRYPQIAFYRYWNDIRFMYHILQLYGFPAENIYVIYNDGVPEDPHTPVHYPATRDSMNAVFGILSEEMGRADDLFFFTTGHGGPHGLSQWIPMNSQGELSHSQVAGWLDSLDYRNMIIVMEQCWSGRFIDFLSSTNRVIMTSCLDQQSSYACENEGNFDEFVYHFMTALVGHHLIYTSYEVDADFNSDGKISMREAYIWAAIKDSRPENPAYNDNGDGQSYQVIQVTMGEGPWLGDSIFLNAP
ncbi:MAG: C13 family peptidase [Candidatus Thorarchaeota archaeon]|jgi:hypothetical protein